jgi:hypothetical protein
MKKSIIIILPAIIVQARGYAQHKIIIENCRPKIFIEAATRIGVEIPVAYGISALAAGSYINNNAYIKGGIKRYCRTKKNSDLFFEMVAFYKNAERKVSDNIRVPDSVVGNFKAGPSFSYETDRQVYGINFEIGENETIRHKRIKFEWYAGIGIRVRTVHASISKQFQEYNLYHFNESFIDYFSNRQVSGAIYPNISLGIRMAYVFRPHKQSLARQ